MSKKIIFYLFLMGSSYYTYSCQAPEASPMDVCSSADCTSEQCSVQKSLCNEGCCDCAALDNNRIPQND
jgi:hypothetical protein